LTASVATGCAFIGDEVTAAGFRLAGADTHCPAPAHAPALFARLLGETGLLLLTQEALGWVGEGTVRAATLAGRPQVLVIPDVRGRSKPPDVGEAIRRQLGMATPQDQVVSRGARAGGGETSKSGAVSRAASSKGGPAAQDSSAGSGNS
jgi:vacuolar-type H+-ATPase subunit F/Vma7